MKIFRKTIYIPCLLVLLFSVSCGKSTKSAVEQPTEEHQEAEQETVSLTTAQIQAINLEMGPIEMKDLTDAIRANGFLKVPNQSKAQITSLQAGVIKSLLIQPGTLVKKGQTVAVLENTGQVLIQEQYLSTVQQIQLAQTELNRQKELYEGNAGALKNLQYAQNQLQTLQIQKASLAKQLQMLGINPATVKRSALQSTITLKAPISGVIREVFAEIGSYVDAGSFSIATIVDNSNLHLDLDIFEKNLAAVKTGQLIHFTLTNNPVKEYDAVIYSIGSAFQDESKSVPVHARVQGDKTGLIDGMSVVAMISIGNQLAPAVPSEAIVNIGAKDYIFIEKKNTGDQQQTLFQKVLVAKGTTDVGYTQFTPLEELPPDAKVVVKGAFFLMAKLTNSGDHAH